MSFHPALRMGGHQHWRVCLPPSASKLGICALLCRFICTLVWYSPCMAAASQGRKLTSIFFSSATAPRSARGKYCSSCTPGFRRMFIRKRRAFSLRTCRDMRKARQVDSKLLSTQWMCSAFTGISGLIGRRRRAPFQRVFDFASPLSLRLLFVCMSVHLSRRTVTLVAWHFCLKLATQVILKGYTSKGQP